jgi:hypothetical protein
LNLSRTSLLSFHYKQYLAFSAYIILCVVSDFRHHIGTKALGCTSN